MLITWGIGILGCLAFLIFFSVALLIVMKVGWETIVGISSLVLWVVFIPYFIGLLMKGFLVI